MSAPIKNHISSVIVKVFKTIKETIFLFVIILVNPSSRNIKIIGALLLLLIGYEFINWYKTCFYIKEGMLIYETGVIEKKVLSLSMDKITTIDFSQNLINRLFNTYRLKLDSGSVQTKGSEIDIVLKKASAIITRDELLSGNKLSESDQEEWGKVFEATNKEMLLTALTKNNLALGIGLFFSMYAFLDDILKALNIKYMDTLSRYIDPSKLVNASITYLLIFIIKAFLVVWVICIILSVIGSTIKLYGFRVYKSKEHIKIEYGLINKKAYSLPIKNVQAVILKQNLIKQKLGLYNIELSTVGYGNEQKEEAILYPIVNKRLMDELINELIPELKEQPEIWHAPKNTLTNFIMVPLIASVIIFSTATFLFNKAVILFLLLPVILVACYLSYRNSAIGFNGSILKAVSGGFNRKSYLVKMESIQSLSIQTNPFQKKKNVGTYVLQYYASKLGDVIKVKNLSNTFFQEIRTKI